MKKQDISDTKSISIRFVVIILFLLGIPPFYIFASSEYISDENKDGKPDMWVSMEDGIIRKVEVDQNYDGKIDNVVIFDEKGRKEYEELDFNFDGVMDDFYYYENGELIRREVDSNYDTIIDIWVILENGIYIKRFERDMDFDGKPDIIKNYSKKKKQY